MDGEAPDIVALRVPLVGDAEIDVIDARGIDPGAGDGGIDHMGGHEGRFGVVEGAAIGFADTRAGGGDDGCFTHEFSPCPFFVDASSMRKSPTLRHGSGQAFPPDA
jgi:hypothetical protein